MRKLLSILILPVLFLGAFWSKDTPKADYLGEYGQYFIPEDTVRITVTIHDTTGLVVAAWDSASILRYYRGTRIDSLDEASGQVANLRTGAYQIKFKADKEGTYDIAGEDSIGQYTVVVHAWKQTKSNQKSFDYVVLRGNGLHAIYDIQWFLGSADNAYRVLYPATGTQPKDSVQYYGIFDRNGNGSIETGDTLLISTVKFYHSNNPGVLDSSKTIFHRNDL